MWSQLSLRNKLLITGISFALLPMLVVVGLVV